MIQLPPSAIQLRFLKKVGSNYGGSREIPY